MGAQPREKMSYQSLYRKWRSQTFAEVVGQEHVTRTLRNALAKKQIAHAYLFAGPRGTGKTSTARILAKALNCQNGPTPEPCQTCPNCQAIKEGNSLDVLEIDAASNRGIDEIRELRERVRFAPIQSNFKVYIIDEAHMLTTEASNALLKTLEEPPEHVIFVLCTTEPNKLPPTILSRCQRFDFRRIPYPVLSQRLRQIIDAEGATIEEEALDILVSSSSGSLRDGESILEQLLSYCDGRITTQAVRELLGLTGEEWLENLTISLLDGDFRSIFNQLESIYSQGNDPRTIARDLLQFLRELLAISVGSEVTIWTAKKDRLENLAHRTNPADIFSFLEPLAGLDWQIRSAVEPRYLLETSLLLGSYKLKVKKEVSQAPIAKTEETETELNIPQETEEKPETQQTPNFDLKELSLEKIRELWPRVLERVKEKSVPVCVFLSKGILSEFTGNHIVISFDKAYTFHKETMGRKENIELLRQTLFEILGIDLQVELAVSDGPSAEEDLKEHPLVRQALELFEGMITEIKEE